MEVFLILSFTLLTFGAHANPWIFQEIKPLSEADTVKKSNIPDKPVHDIDPTTPTIHIKQDIREDILGKNSTKFKEGVKKLLDFLEAGPKAIGDSTLVNGTQDNSKKDNQILKQNNESLSYKQDKKSDFKQANGINSKELNNVANGDNLNSFDKDNHNDKTQKDSNSNYVAQQKEPPAIPMRSEINGNGLPPSHSTVSLLHDGMMDKDLHSDANNGDHLSSFSKDVNHDDKPLKESNSNFLTQQKEPPAIPMRSVINSYGMFPGHATAALLHNSGAMMGKAGVGGNVVPKSQIPYSSMPYQTQILQNNAIARGIRNYKMPNPVSAHNVQYYPYSTLYQRSSFLHHYGNYGVPQRPIPMAYRYPYNQRRMLPQKSISFNPASRTNIRLPFYKSAMLNPRLRLPYSKTFVPRRPAMIPQRAPMSLFPARRSHIPGFQNFHISQPHHAYPGFPKWNLLARKNILKPVRAMKYRRMAVNERGHSYNGLSSPRDKVAQKTPLPLPLASIMTAARIVVPARPHNLNGVFKSNVEAMPSADPEEKGARAV